MDDHEKAITPNESLKLIEEMINRARNNFGDNGHLYLLWGWVIALCSLGHFVMWHFRLVAHPEMIWMVTWATMIYQAVYLRKRKKASRVKTYSDDILGYVWLVFVVCLALTAFVLIQYKERQALYSMFLVLYGVPTFLSGKVLKVRELTIGGVFCWVLAIASTFIIVKFQLLLIMLSVIVAWIVPGYAMKAKYNKQKLYGEGE
ncbi:hypothetical protein EXU57_12040 [Segetibacter sp. 3557_3]|uniref:hypothetical protein n=1 Tax=Segetibacter sp. 3557_3 TaxID=2547429 RepID=UPI001058F442|nr:hypothetical protein [Segetibacter sp. 3557_3]TDH26213.1 hypothetical protein EXU57_12040 [Segetibacter sp. 3557_3]